MLTRPEAPSELVTPMQNRWESSLTAAQGEAPELRQQLASAPNVKERAQAAQARAKKGDKARHSASGSQGSTRVGDTYLDAGARSPSGRPKPGPHRRDPPDVNLRRSPSS
ncbi:MAG: hypothetical protein JWP82_1845 [Humibacillus sp.]|nr:hypothetical protein [Humibacillus sp.]